MSALQQMLLGSVSAAAAAGRTWSTTDKSSEVTLSNGNLTITKSTGTSTFGNIRGDSSSGKSTGKWYWEILHTSDVNSSTGAGTSAASLTGERIGAADANAVGYSTDGNQWYNAGTLSPTTHPLWPYSNGDRLMVAFDRDANKIWFGLNGTWINSGNPGAGTGESGHALPAGTIFPMHELYGSGGASATANFGATAPVYPIPSGFSTIDGTRTGAAPTVTTYSTPGTQTISKPVGATKLMVRAIAAGGGAYKSSSIRRGGGGGAFAQRSAYDVSAISAVYISVPASTGGNIAGGAATVQETNSGGTMICSAEGGYAGAPGAGGAGGQNTNCVGTFAFSGGTGATVTSTTNPAGGGGAANSTTAGVNGSVAGGGAAGAGTLGAGAGGDTTTIDGFSYGGGGTAATAGAGSGAQGVIELTWFF